MWMFISGCDPFKLVRTRQRHHYANFSQVGIYRAVKYKWTFLRNEEKILSECKYIIIIIPTCYLSKGLDKFWNQAVGHFDTPLWLK